MAKTKKTKKPQKISRPSLQSQIDALAQDVIIKFNHLKVAQEDTNKRVAKVEAPVDRQSIGQKAFSRILRLEDDVQPLLRKVRKK